MPVGPGTTALPQSIPCDDLDEDAAPAGALRDQELLRKFAAVEQMDEEDRRVIASLIDAYIKKHQIEEVLHR